MKTIFWLLFVSLPVHAQKINFSAKLLDKKTKEPIVYANISFLETSMGVSSSEDGTFSLEIDKKLLNEKVHISCLNYKDTIVLASTIQNNRLHLSPNVFKLDEVFLKKDTKQVIVDNIKRKNVKDGFYGSRKFPWIVTKFFSNTKEYTTTPFVKSVEIHYAKMSSHNAKYRLRFYKNEKGKPGSDLVTESIIVLKEKKDKSNTVDLYKYNIQMPKEGFYMGLERLNIPYNFQEFEAVDHITKEKSTKTSVLPMFGGTRTINNGTWFFQNGTWRNLKLAKHKDNSSLVPAISLTLSN